MENIGEKSRYAFIAKKTTHALGGYREKEILRNPHCMKKGETWNDEHKVVHVIATDADESGHSDAYSVDVVTQRIVG